MMKRCLKCLMPDTRPDTPFIDGVCSACINHEKQKEIDWNARKQQLAKLLESSKPNGSGFDCVVASSGGKDSHAQVLALLDLEVRPLIVTATTCWLTEIGRHNIDNLKRYAPTIEVTPHQGTRAKLNSLGLRLVGDISWPEHVAIFTTPLRMAVALGIPLVFYGENPQAQYGGPAGSEDATQMTQRWVSEFGGFLGLRPSDMVGKECITAAEMAEYAFPTPQQIKKAKTQVHFLGQYLGPWDSHANAKRAIKAGMQWELPCRANYWAHENLDNAMTGIHDYMMYRKYGYGRGCAQLSVDIRNGKISREMAEAKLAELEQSIYPRTYMGIDLEDILWKIGLSGYQFDCIVEGFTNDEFRPIGAR